ncbi:ABC transporter permease [Skermanella sp. TT6]|uniref:ABC transporter permease n=1 Tax=Skermanella cutis TaxID=2775420 RepID=A0ABX7BBJ5_9PROT|nr:ABC transporter permease [Skermanella sp. TT6]QQP91764.1 ABC transporter permease [Skermanella sp. TT6]
MSAPAAPAVRRGTRIDPVRLLRTLLPAIALALMLTVIFSQQPRAMSYVGLTLLLNLAVPVILATLAQLCVITVGDLDLSIGSFVGLCACIAATLLHQTPFLGVLALAAAVAAYGLVGALIHWRNLPSIVVTLGLSFIWTGLAVLILPTPGGRAPEYLTAVMKWKPDYVPLPILYAAALGIALHLLMRSSFGTILRGAGGNPKALANAGWSLLRARVTLYLIAGGLGTLSGLALVGLTTSGDANMALRYTLMSIAGVILGGGEFTGGRVNPVGAVLGAMTLTLAGSFLTFMHIPPDWQIGAQGAILIVVLALRAVLNRAEERA